VHGEIEALERDHAVAKVLPTPSSATTGVPGLE
jgi:hypothetical protein